MRKKTHLDSNFLTEPAALKGSYKRRCGRRRSLLLTESKSVHHEFEVVTEDGSVIDLF